MTCLGFVAKLTYSAHRSILKQSEWQLNGKRMISFKGRHHKQELVLQCVRWHVAYSLSYRDLEEFMVERGYVVDHSTIQRWVVHSAPRIEKVFRQNKKRTGLRWRMDESYLKINGQ